MSPLRKKYLHAMDWMLLLEIRVVETWVTAFSFLVGTVLSALPNGAWKVYGATLMFAAVVNFIGLALSLVHQFKLSRCLRWIGSMLAATVWAACWLIPPSGGFDAGRWGAVYELLFFQRLWIAMSLVYRGTTSGINP